jgi:hypothetical protein
MDPDVRQALTTLMDNLADAVKDVDVERYLTYFDKGDAFTFTQDGIVTRSWEGYADLKRGVWGEVLESVERFEYDLIVQPIGDDAGVVTMTFDMKATMPTGDMLAGGGTYTAVCSKKSGEWKVVNGAEYFQPSE